MQRRSAVGRLAAAAAGLSLGTVPSLEPALPLEENSFSVTGTNLARSSGVVTCPVCQEMADALDLTPAGLCLRCADQNPALRAEAYSDRFWALSPREVCRLEREIERLAAEGRRMDEKFARLRQQQMAAGGDGYDRAMESERNRWHALQRELHLLQMLRA
ncbi:MAG: hypothetical protein ACJ8CN_12860, partial [Gemmatimonadales bacterium]